MNRIINLICVYFKILNLGVAFIFQHKYLPNFYVSNQEQYNLRLGSQLVEETLIFRYEDDREDFVKLVHNLTELTLVIPSQHSKIKRKKISNC